MPAVRNVGARFIAPACRTCTLGDIEKLLPRAMPHRAFRLIHRGPGEKCGLDSLRKTVCSESGGIIRTGRSA